MLLIYMHSNPFILEEICTKKKNMLVEGERVEGYGQ